MSYSFSARGVTKVALLAAIAAQYDTVVEHQPIHAADVPAANGAVASFINLFAEPTDIQELNASVSGSVSTKGYEAGSDLTGTNISINIGYVDRVPLTSVGDSADNPASGNEQAA